MTSRTWRGRVFIGTSIDGYIARVDGSIDWLTDLPAGGHEVPHAQDRRALTWETFYPAIDSIVMGRATYDTVLGFGEWPFPGKSVVVLTTRSLDDPRVVCAPSPEQAAAALEESGARQVYIDGGRTIQEFLRRGLVDEITVSIAPVLLGGGRPLFGALDEELELVVRGLHATDDGLVRVTYDVGRVS